MSNYKLFPILRGDHFGRAGGLATSLFHISSCSVRVFMTCSLSSVSLHIIYRVYRSPSVIWRCLRLPTYRFCLMVHFLFLFFI